MPKLWDCLKPEAKTRIMAYRHYLEKKENKKEGTVRKDGNKLIMEEADINTVLAYAIRDYQFSNQNEMPEVVIVQCGPTVKGKDRNGQEYTVPVMVSQAKSPDLPAIFQKSDAGESTPKTLGDYICPECKRTHREGSKIYNRHLKYLK